MPYYELFLVIVNPEVALILKAISLVLESVKNAYKPKAMESRAAWGASAPPLEKNLGITCNNDK